NEKRLLGVFFRFCCRAFSLSISFFLGSRRCFIVLGIGRTYHLESYISLTWIWRGGSVKSMNSLNHHVYSIINTFMFLNLKHNAYFFTRIMILDD
ncbi:hypothetical protein DY008_28890, partial [Klebsiella variicola]